MPQFIEIRGARVNNLKNIDVDIPLGKIVGICGVSGSGKSSLALGILYSEGFRKYLNALSAYSKRRISQPKKAKIDSIRYLPSTIALRQRPAVPGIRSTVGTMTETLNVVRLMFSRLGSHPCPNGHLVDPSVEGLRNWESICCPQCGEIFPLPGAESFSFNSDGACKKCEGLGFVRVVNPKKLIPDENLTVEQGAVSPWRMVGRILTPLVVKELGVRVDVPYKDLTDEEKHIILHGEEGIHKIVYTNDSGKAVPLNVNYENAYLAVMNSSKSSSELTLAKVERYFDTEICPQCNGSRVNASTSASRLCGCNICEVSSMTIGKLLDFAKKLRNNLPPGVEKIATELLKELSIKLDVLNALGVSYLAIDRLGNSLSNGELQRIQLAKIIQNDTTGVLYVFDEPSIGLHPSNIEGIVKSIRYLAENGNTVVFVDHNTLLLKEADYLLEIGPGAGESGGYVICSGSPSEIVANENSIVGSYLAPGNNCSVSDLQVDIFEHGAIEINVREKFNLKNVITKFPINKLSVVAGVSGSGKTTLVLECLVESIRTGKNFPNFIEKLETGRIKNVQFVDASPIGKNSRSTVATYTGIFDLIRKLFAGTVEAVAEKYTESWFSHNNEHGRCATCEGLGEMDIDVQYLPDISVPCPDCNGTRYNAKIAKILYEGKSIVDVLAMTIHEAIKFFEKEPNIQKRLINMESIGLGYLTLGEGTPALSGGEAQRMRLSMEINKVHKHTLFVLDEPTIGLHPRDVEVLIRTMRMLIANGATIVVIEHDIDVIKNADYVIEMGEKGGPEGGKIIATGTTSEILKNSRSLIAKWMK